jgi:hypothetical protein
MTASGQNATVGVSEVFVLSRSRKFGTWSGRATAGGSETRPYGCLC